jgi:hypothetical protein
MVHLEYFPTEQIEFRRELQEHPDIMTHLIMNYGAEPSFEVVLGAVAAWLSIPVDNYFTTEELNKLCDTLTKELRQKRKIVILS